MKKILLFAVTISLLSCGGEVETQDGYKGAVKSITTTEYRAVSRGGEITSGDILSISKREYDEAGYLVNNSRIKGGEFESDYRITYDKDHRLIRVIGKNEYNHTIYREDYEYNSNGDKTSRKIWDIDTGTENMRSYTLYEYDQDNNCISESMHRPDGNLVSKTLFTYVGKICINNCRYDYGNLRYETIYDEENGNMLKQIKYYTEYVVPIDHQYMEVELIYSYDDNGKQTSRTVISYSDPEDLLLASKDIPQLFFIDYKSVTFVDENELDIRKEHTSYEEHTSGKDVKWTTTKVLSYDEYQNEIECRTTNSFSDKTDVSKTVYKYDDKGNWIEKIYTESDKPEKNSITKNTISYYK